MPGRQSDVLGIDQYDFTEAVAFVLRCRLLTMRFRNNRFMRSI